MQFSVSTFCNIPSNTTEVKLVVLSFELEIEDKQIMLDANAKIFKLIQDTHSMITDLNQVLPFHITRE